MCVAQLAQDQFSRREAAATTGCGLPTPPSGHFQQSNTTRFCLDGGHLSSAATNLRLCGCVRVQKPHLASPEELARFHSDDYVDFLRRVTPEAAKSLGAYMSRCGRRRSPPW
jgi:acetoin utilization deacetylase AcuC-like enzyme